MNPKKLATSVRVITNASNCYDHDRGQGGCVDDLRHYSGQDQ